MIKSIYIHIPFCKNICSYCDFCKNYYNKNTVYKYLDKLNEEIINNYQNEIIDTLYIGGGTPSSFSINELTKLFEITKIFKLNKEYEFTFECNYDDITEQLLILLKNNKVNRISIGIQTFNEKFSNLLNRKINRKEMIDRVNLTKKYFNNVNIDLMYGIFGETISDLKSDLKMIKRLGVKHISTYCLILEEHTMLGLKGIKENSDLQCEMYDIIMNFLKENNYKHYEISNFAKDGFESRHNLTYWNNEEYYGFGCGASGFVNDIRYDNTKSITSYIKGNITLNREQMDTLTKMNDEVMLGLRKISGINKKDFKNKYHVNFKDKYDIDCFIFNGLLIEDEEKIYIPEKYLFVSDEIILKILS